MISSTSCTNVHHLSSPENAQCGILMRLAVVHQLYSEIFRQQTEPYRYLFWMCNDSFRKLLRISGPEIMDGAEHLSISKVVNVIYTWNFHHWVSFTTELEWRHLFYIFWRHQKSVSILGNTCWSPDWAETSPIIILS